ncbi:RDD family protein [Amycolatopsis echigonensis]|uniref:RDD family protein n=1 Tax=Amycolatopsis echigonensis TaxID=2576905 RepID=A0A2N3WL22_9PSEU|nr:RDD family protein [Amycolatopsis niigatensis]PKV94552.1 RDD family protein [Amycolatopsis niigatensis]
MKTEQDVLARVRTQAEPVLGKGVAARIRAFENGDLYVEARTASTIWAWLVDVLLVTGLSVAAAVAYYFRSTAVDAAAGASVIGVAGLFVLPLLYGWFYGNGRGLGALFNGIRLVRLRDGGRIGLGKAGWAMLVRTLGFVIIALGVLNGDVTVANGVRTSIDVRETERLRAAGLVGKP